MPNRLDFLIIKKDADAISENGIGKIFRKYNFFEYKSPGQNLGLNTYHLNMAYAHLYVHYEKDVRFGDIILSFVREGKPVKLIKYFKEHGFAITEPESGIYHARKNEHPPMQVIVTRELGKRYIWLKALTDRLTREEAMALAEEAEKEKDPQGKKRIRSILDLVSSLNSNKIWMKEMATMGIRDLFKEEFEEKDHMIAEQEKQIQSLHEQLQNKDMKLQTEQEEITRLRKELEELKKQSGKIAVL